MVQVVESLRQPSAVLRDSFLSVYYSVFAFLLVLQGTHLTYLVFAKKLYWGDLPLKDLLVDDVFLALFDETALLILHS